MFMIEQNKAVLVVDDEPLVLKYTTSVIRRLGYATVLRAESAATARALLMAAPLSLVISDVSLPDGDGRDVLCDALEQHPHAAGVLITGFSSDDLKLPDALVGRVLLLQKPFTADDLTALLAELLERPSEPASALA